MSRQARVGLLVFAGIALFLVALFAIANRSFLLSDVFVINSRFSSVAGLQSGAAVQYQGVNVGRVESVALPGAPGEPIVVTMAIQERARHLIRENTQAQIKSDGLVGNQIVVLVSPGAPGEPVEDGEFVPGNSPFDLYEITDRLLASVRTFEETAIAAREVVEDVQGGTGTLGKVIYDPTIYNSFVQTATEAQALMASLGQNAEALVGLASQATEGVQDLLVEVREGEGTVPKLINDPAVFNSLLASADTLQTIAGDFRAITQNVENASQWANLGAFRFAENMEALKSNWAFKRYYEERGYMEQAPFEMREAALAESYQELEQQRTELARWQAQLRELMERLEAAGVDVEVPPGLRTGLDAEASDAQPPAEPRPSEEVPAEGIPEATAGGTGASGNAP